MRPRRFLLLTTTLSSATLVAACRQEPKEQPPPGNPKGSVYDAGIAERPIAANTKGSHYVIGNPVPEAGAGETDSGAPSPPKVMPKPDAGPVIPRRPANPKGSHYDRNSEKKPPPSSE